MKLGAYDWGGLVNDMYNLLHDGVSWAALVLMAATHNDDDNGILVPEKQIRNAILIWLAPGLLGVIIAMGGFSVSRELTIRIQQHERLREEFDTNNLAHNRQIFELEKQTMLLTQQLAEMRKLLDGVSIDVRDMRNASIGVGTKRR